MNRGFTHAWCADARGVSALEFAIAAPIFGLLIAGVIDYGSALYAKFSLDGAVAAAGNYAVLNAASVSSSNGAALATSLAQIMSSGHSANWANATVVVNNGPTATLTGGTLSSGGTPTNADTCYCPTSAGAGIASGVNWGAAATCASSCTGGGFAGKYVTIAATRSYQALFPGLKLFGAMNPQTHVVTITAGAVVETQ